MYRAVKIAENIFYAGVNDRRTHLFENLMPIERGVAYNSYVINDEKVAIVDAVEIGQVDRFLKKVEGIIGDKPVDYLVINHMEPDHAGAVNILASLYPDMKLVGNKKTKPMVEGFFGLGDRFVEVGEGDTIELGKNSLQFFLAPMVHWPETMVSYNPQNKVLFSGDAFGSFGTLDGAVFDDELDIDYFKDEMRRYYSNIVGKYGSPVQKALDKLAGLDFEIVAATHGPVLRSHIDEVIKMYQDWSTHTTQEGVVIAYASMYGNTEDMAEVVARELVEQGVKSVRMYDVSKTDSSYIISDIFKYKGLILGSPTYTNELHPNMESLINKIEHIGVKNHVVGVFGSFSWAGTAVKLLNGFVERMDWEIVGDPVEQKHALQKDKFEELRKLGKAMADSL
ncbi:FprA family A-type flavoprotein [Marinilabiliaceae bacterium ANBcel2]|nr:FprA family A-type flavoprotein [Marinilabiliaceae bacterium ANBcel2]